jgi:hypothetical protein
MYQFARNSRLPKYFASSAYSELLKNTANTLADNSCQNGLGIRGIFFFCVVKDA